MIEPVSGTPNSWVMTKIYSVPLNRPTSSGGVILPIRISGRRRGATISWSNEPSSRSRDTDCPATDIAEIEATVATSAGSTKRRKSRLGLNIWRMMVVPLLLVSGGKPRSAAPVLAAICEI